MIGSAVPMPSTYEEKVARFGGVEPDNYGRMPISAMVNARVELQGPSSNSIDSLTSTSSWFPWVLGGLPDDPNYVCPALASDRSDLPNGRTENVLLNIGSTAVHVISHLMGLQNKTVMNETWIRAYATAFPTMKSSVGALNFPMDAMHQLKLSPEAQSFPHEAVTPDSVAAIKKLPIWIVVGRHDHAISISRIEQVSRSYGSCPYVILENVGHFIQEDAPEIMVALLQMFVQSTGGTLPSFENALGATNA